MSQNKYDPIMIKIIRAAMVKKISEEIIGMGVQPMGMGSPFSKEEYPYQINILDFISFRDIIAVLEWCRETLKDDEWDSKVQYFAFKNEQAYSWFLLRWK